MGQGDAATERGGEGSGDRAKESTMVKQWRTRRVVSLVLVVAGILTMLMSPSVESGIALFMLGVMLELVGLALRHRDAR